MEALGSAEGRTAFASVDTIRRLIDAGSASAEEVVRASLERIADLNQALNAVVAVRAEPALAEARAADALSPRKRGPLHGVPFAVKDVTETLDLPTTYGSVAFAGHHAGLEALVVSRLREAGAILVGKTNTPPFACEPVTRGELFGETINPWAPERTPGGSSGGAAAGLATGMFTLAQGTDAGGSNRIPASCCGVVGVKPTRGRVSFAPSAYEPWGGLLHSGPLARSVRDAAVMLDVMAGPALGEPAVGSDGLACREACGLDVGPVRAAYSSSVAGGRVDDEVAAAFSDALDVFRSLGVELVEGSPDFSGLAAPFTTIAEAAFAGMAKEMTEAQLETVGAGPRQLIDQGRRIDAGTYYAAIQSARREAATILRFWEEFDVLITPTVPWLPPLRGEFPAVEGYEEKWAQYGLWEVFTSPANVTGQPALSLPCRLSGPAGVPIGVQLIGRYGGEADLFTLAAAYEHAAPWADRTPDTARFSSRARTGGGGSS